MKEIIRRDGEDVFLILRIKPNAKRTGFSEEYGGEIILNIKSPPTKGKANREIEKFLKSLFKKHTTIVKGKKSDTKIVQIENCNLTDGEIHTILHQET